MLRGWKTHDTKGMTDPKRRELVEVEIDGLWFLAVVAELIDGRQTTDLTQTTAGAVQAGLVEGALAKLDKTG